MKDLAFYFKEPPSESTDEKVCGFKYWLSCTKECRFYETCTRNPHKRGDKK